VSELGTARIEPDGTFEVGTTGYWRLVFEAGPRGIAQGGGIRVQTPGEGHSIFGLPGLEHLGDIAKKHWAGTARGKRQPVRVAARVTCSRADASVQATILPIWDVPETIWNSATHFRIFAVTLSKGVLKPGDAITIELGLEERDRPMRLGRSAPHKRRSDVVYPVWVDTGGHGQFEPLADPPRIRLVGAPACYADVVAPSVAAAGRSIPVRISLQDAFRNPDVSFEGALQVADRSVSLTPEDGGVKHLDLAPDARASCARVEVRGAGLAARSNPCRLVDGAPEYNVYWGELHGHTGISCDANFRGGVRGRPRDAFEYVREVVLCEFCGLTDHHNAHVGEHGSPSHHCRITPEQWAETQEAVRDAYEPGAFVPFLGLEWRDSRGDTNVYFRDHTGECIPAGITTIREIWQAYRGKDVLTVPHLHPHSTKGHGHAYKDELWVENEPEIERLIEIYSSHGRFEYFENEPHFPKAGMDPRSRRNTVQGMFARGHRLGITCGTDNHGATPTILGSAKGAVRGSMTAILAPELTREALWQALRARRTYGTTGARIYLDFRVNGAVMGAELDATTNRDVRAVIHGTGPIRQVDIVRSGEDVFSLAGEGKEDLTLAWAEDRDGETADYYYLRVLQEDTNMAWSSPVWVG